jgi:hypothetical protein
MIRTCGWPIAAEYGAKWPKVAKLIDDLDVLLTFYDHPAEHWIHLRTTNSMESTFATVRLRTRVTQGPGSRGQVRLRDGVGCMDGLRHAGWAGR